MGSMLDIIKNNRTMEYFQNTLLTTLRCFRLLILLLKMAESEKNSSNIHVINTYLKQNLFPFTCFFLKHV